MAADICAVKKKKKKKVLSGMFWYLSLQDQMLPFPVLEHLKWLQRTDNIHRIHCRLLTDLWTGQNKKQG